MNSSIEKLYGIQPSIKPIKEKVIHKGGNSTVYEWENKRGFYIVKKFSGSNSNISERFEREKTSLVLLERNGIKNVPKLLYSNFDAKIIITNKVPGVRPNKVTLDIFIKHYNMTNLLLNDKLIIPKGLEIKNASDSLLDPIELIRKVRKELNTVIKLIGEDNNARNNFYLEANNIIDQKEKSTCVQIDNTLISRQKKVYSFSDLGPRNMLLDKTDLYFVDFEHAGWDDPIKGIIDLLICPTNNITKDDAKEIVSYILSNNEQYNFRENFMSWLPILNIKWAIIYIKYNLKLHQKKLIDIREVERIYLGGRQIIRHIENVVNSNN